MRAWFPAAVVTLLLAATGWPALGVSAPGRFVPDEIIVKFRTPARDANDTVADTVSGKSVPSRDLREYGARFRVREIRPILKDFDRRQALLRSLRDLDSSRLTQNQRHLLRRQRRAVTTSSRPGLGSIYRVHLDLDAGASLDSVLAAYRSRPDVEYAEANPRISICATPDDPWYASQWSLGKIHAAEAWDTCRGGSEVIVAVIDTGVDTNHPDLRANLWTNGAEQDGLPDVDDDDNGYVDDIRGYNLVHSNSDPMDDHGHGTHCAGIIAAVGDNGTDIAGVCWSARIMPVKILNSIGEGSAADAVPAVYYAVANGADIISGSWGGAEVSHALRDAIAYAHDQGVVVVAAAGNFGSDTPFYPAAYPEVISVAATESNDRRWYLSDYGDWVDIAAPGRDITSLLATLPGQAVRAGGRSVKSGTSMAAPHVSGACALLLAANPLLRCDELQQILTTTADPIAPGICSSNGRLNVYNALRAVIPPAGTIRLDRAFYLQGADIGLLMADWDLKGAGYCTVLVETAGGDQETVTLWETDISLGVFRGTLASENAPVNLGDGILQVHDGEGIQARYLDANDGAGHAGQWRDAGAAADYLPPSVVSLETASRAGMTTVEFRTSEPTRAEVRFGQALGGPYLSIRRDPVLSEQHHVELRGLSVQTQYYLVVTITDEAGNEALADNDGQSYSFIAQRD